MKRLIIIASLLLLTGGVWAQKLKAAPQQPQVSKKAQAERRTETRSGNSAYSHKRYDEANKHYSQALKADSTYYKAQYNLGNTLYRQGNYNQAEQCFGRALQNPSLKPSEKSKIHYNMGNSQLQAGLKEKQAAQSGQGDPQNNGMENFKKAVSNYQEALKIDPKNKEAKYNLSYAMKMLQTAKNQQQQNQKNGGGQNNQQQQNQQQQQKQGRGQQGQDKKQGQGDKDQQNQNQNQNPKDQKDDQGKGDQKKDSNKQPQQKPQDQQKKDQQKKQAEQLLNAVKNNEKQTMKEQQKAREAKVDARIEKDW